MGYRKRSRIDNCLFISYLHDKLPFMLLRIRVSNNFGDKHGLYKTGSSRKHGAYVKLGN